MHDAARFIKHVTLITTVEGRYKKKSSSFVNFQKVQATKMQK